MDTQFYCNMDNNHTNFRCAGRDISYDPRVTLDKYLPAEWHIYVLPRLRMGVILGNNVLRIWQSTDCTPWICLLIQLSHIPRLST